MLNTPVVTSREAWREYLGLYRGRWGSIALAVTVAVLPSVLLVTAALLVRRVFDVAIATNDAGQLIVLVASIVALQLLAHALFLVARSLVLTLTKSVISTLRERLVDALLVTSRSYLDRRNSSELHGLIVDDSDRIDAMSNEAISTLLPAITSTIALLALLLTISPKLTLVIIAFAPVAVFATRWIRKEARQSARHYHDSFRRFSQGAATAVRMLDLTRVQAAEEIERRGSAARIADLRATSGRMAWLQTALLVMHQAVLAAAVAVALLAGGLLVIGGEMTLGELMAFLIATALLRNQLVPAGPATGTVIRGEDSLRRLFGFLQLAPPESYRGTGVVEFNGDVALENVRFSYDEGRVILDGVSMRIDSGSVVALIGANGSGKSTILRLILGFYAPQEGRITASGADYRTLDIRRLRREIGVVMQDSLILDGTVRQNITYGVENVSDEEIERAVQLACATEMIERLPEGLETEVGENGHLLSGGQRQRIAIARALLRRPRLLVLDEPTRHLDRTSVEALLRMLRSADWPHATLVVSHDDELTATADSVYELAQGRLTHVRARAEALR